MRQSWDQLIQAFCEEGWSVGVDNWGVTVEISRESDILFDFSKDREGLQKAQQFWDAYRHGQGDVRQPGLDELRTALQELVNEDRAAGRVNTLLALQESQQRRGRIEHYLKRLKWALQHIEAIIEELPKHPERTQIQWAQTVGAMPNLAFLEIDTTGLHADDEITRFTLLDKDGKIISDVFISPHSHPLSAEASAASGIQPAQLEHAISIESAWEQIQNALAGRYIISFGLEWDLQQLQKASERHHLEPVLVIGDCLQRHATRYYHGEYYLKLEDLCARMGSPLPPKPHQTSLDRAKGQHAVLQAIAQAVTDLRQEESTTSTTVPAGPREEATSDDFDPFLDSEDLP